MQSLELGRPLDADGLLATAIHERIEALLVLPVDLEPDGLRKLSKRLPTVDLTGAKENFERGGGLIYYFPNIVEQARRTAFLVDKILRGAKPRELPIEQPTKFEFELVINLEAAKALGLTIPRSLLIRADEVIQ